MTQDNPAEQLIELVVHDLAAGGDGVGRDDNSRVTFVPHTAPKDRVRVRITEQKKSFARGLLEEVLEASPARVEAKCEYFRDSDCGGCQWQHISRAAQLEAKQNIVAAALRKAVGRGLEIAPILDPVSEFGWRRRARMHWVRPRRADKAVIGFHALRSDRVSQIDTCPQLERSLDAALAIVHQQLAPSLTGSGEIDLLVGHQGDVHITVRGPCDPKHVKELVDHAPIVGTALGKRRFGAPDVELEPTLRARADEFAQASAAGNATLVELVKAACGDVRGKRVLELYAGNGNFTRLLSGAEKIVAVDSHSVPELEHPHRTIRRQADGVVQDLTRKKKRFDLVLLDPPRTGARTAAKSIPALRPERIVYVSCDPATLARDTETLVEKGYKFVSAQPIDLMPQTAHVEVVAVLELTAP